MNIVIRPPFLACPVGTQGIEAVSIKIDAPTKGDELVDGGVVNDQDLLMMASKASGFVVKNCTAVGQAVDVFQALQKN